MGLSTTTTIQIPPQLPSTTDTKLPVSSDQVFCQIWGFTVLKQDAVHIASGVTAGLTVSLFVSTPLGGAASIFLGASAAVTQGQIAEDLYVKCRHVRATEVQPRQKTTFTGDDNETTLFIAPEKT